ncbi:MULTISPECIES: hypothetical protein [unclassified Streptomyces]|uniref:hypothetical protein n=1 Tax=unclassified Streptomyces TaxID=2593676 RepID=UPI003BB7100B
MMPATLTVSHSLSLVPSVVPVSKPLGAPLSRTDDAVVIPAPCMACGAPADVDGWRWENVGGRGLLIHGDDTVCPVAQPFDWATGAPLPAEVAA